MTDAQKKLWHAALAEELHALETHGGRSRAAERMMRQLRSDMLREEVFMAWPK